MKYLLLHDPTFAIDDLRTALEAEEVTPQAVPDASALVPGDVPTVFMLDAGARGTVPAAQIRRFVEQGGAVVAVVEDDGEMLPEGLDEHHVDAVVSANGTVKQTLMAVRTAYRDALSRREAELARHEAAQRSRELAELTRIGMALSTERDYNTLLELILRQALELTGSDAGSLYIVERPEHEDPRLRFKLAMNVSRPDIPFVELTMPLSVSSIAGNVATTGETLVIDDVYQLSPDLPYTFNRSIDEKYGYRSKSMLTTPMKDHKEEVIGVLQLINRKRHASTTLTAPESFEAEVTTFTERQIDLVSALAGQAAVSIENSQLYEDIERLFEGFVRASVTAIEQRDPTTFGHSGRVASMTVALAKVVDRDTQGPYKHVNFSREEVREIRYAGLLHDFGKVGVREQVLVKAKKLYPPDLGLIKQRYAFIRRTADSEHYRQRMQYLEDHGKSGYEEFCGKLRGEYDARIEELDHFMQLVLKSNEPTVLPEGSLHDLMRWASTFYEDLEGNEQPYLSDDEVRFLSIRKGSLDESERLEIESHVTHTYRFLLQIPWTKELQSIPSIAYGHHEKLDGRGYPRRVKGDDIPIQTRMMTISDIFDALTASDRPYKRAVPVPRALDILSDETKGGMLDFELFRLFTDAKAYEKADEDEVA
jgi:HD-GYP domain-containing protein (c-di-GMP phosphodiesterase class II)